EARLTSHSEAGDVADITLFRVGSASASVGAGDPSDRLREWANTPWCAFERVSDARPPGRGDRYRHLEGRAIAGPGRRGREGHEPARRELRPCRGRHRRGERLLYGAASRAGRTKRSRLR